MAGALIDYVCRAPKHADGATLKPGLGTASPVTLHQRRWAYCPSGALDGHDWVEIEPEMLGLVKTAPTNLRARTAAKR